MKKIIFLSIFFYLRICYNLKKVTYKEKQMEDGLIAIVKSQLETHELWEIDDCVRILFELIHEE